MKNVKWYEMGISQIEKKLNTNAASGLSRKAARSRANRNAGSLFYTPRKPAYRLFYELLADFSLIILLVAAAVSLFFEEGRRQATMVLIISGINLTVSLLLYYQSQRTVESLASFFYPMARVVRGGKLFLVDFRSVVPGDVILLEEGDILCCDARLVSSEGLRVQMRVDKTKYVSLNKDANGTVPSGEHRATEFINLVHAGSIIEAGSARAIVTAVGRYTYLGAMTGGLLLPISTSAPKTVDRLRKSSAKINMILLLAVLPFTLIGLLLSHLNGGTVLLSSAFLTALSLVSTTMSVLVSTMSRLFYAQKVRSLVTNKDPSILKSVEALDKLASADYVFLLDGCALTDGIRHFHAAVCADGEIRNTSAMGETAKRFTELISLYHSSATGMLTTGVSNAGTYEAALREYIVKSGVDRDALQIRCSIHAYVPGNLKDTADRVKFSDRGVEQNLYVSSSPYILGQCQFAMINGVRQRLSGEGLKNLEDMWKKYVSAHLSPLCFVLANEVCEDLCFVGFFLLREGIDKNLSAHINRLEGLGCKVISFPNHAPNTPKIPRQLQAGAASKSDFEKNKLPITYQFGKIRCYTGFSTDDILTLVHFVHKQNKKVVAIGFSESSLEVASCVDSFITCAPIHAKTMGYLDEEIRTRELSGQHYSLSCTQIVKEKADCILPRPNSGRGGLMSLIHAVEQIKTAHRNLSDFLRYAVITQIIRLVIVAFPLLIGQAVLDARHVLFCSCILDLFAMMSFMNNRNYYGDRGRKNYCDVETPVGYLRGDAFALIAGLVAGGATVLLPELVGWIGFAGMYHDKVELSFTSLILLHLVVLIYVGLDRCPSSLKIKQIYQNIWLLVEAAFVPVFLVLCFVWTDFGGFFGFENLLSVPYLLLALLPSILYAALVLILPLLNIGKGKQKKK